MKLKPHSGIHFIVTGPLDPIQLAHQAFREGDASFLRSLLEQHPALKTQINEPLPETFGSPPILMAKSPEMLDVLLDAGADIHAKSRWWAGGFGLLHVADPDLARYAIKRGARIDAHAAARLDMPDALRKLLDLNPHVVRERGGDGQMPLHFAATVEIAEMLLDHGAEIDARDLDHDSTPAQWMLDDRQEVARFLVSRGCKTDLLMAAALGDIDLVRQHLQADPECIRLRVNEHFYPVLGKNGGGTIYQWKLGWHVSAHQVARNFGHEELLQLLMDSSPSDVKLTAAAWLGDEALVRDLLAKEPGLTGNLTKSDLQQLVHAARNDDSVTAKIMLEAGWPTDQRGQHNATALHWASWHGNAGLVRLLLEQSPELEDTANEFNSTPLGWAIHGSENGWHRERGDYPATVELLLKAGAAPPASISGTPAVRSMLEKWQKGQTG